MRSCTPCPQHLLASMSAFVYRNVFVLRPADEELLQLTILPIRVQNHFLVSHQVLSGNRLELHPKIPDSVKVLIQLTMVDPDHRPKFSELRDNLLGTNFEDGM